MFDIGFWELAIISVIALLVLGPERLPRVARTVGKYLSKARRTWSSVRREIERELAAEDLKRELEQPMKAATEVRDELSESLRSAKAEAEFDPARHVAEAPENAAEGDSADASVPDKAEESLKEGKA